ncbi:MAG: kinase [Verrucomicrobiota bacterium]|jgi:D-glycero-alpha-D-manno-heptose-7-phosphate kinase|nr:kinase [Verrucomicrobiota bacterium]
MIISRTPFRISFFGGGTDFPSFFRRHGGAVLSATINKYCYISIHRLTPFFRHRFRASYSRTESVLTPSEFQHPLIRETLLLLEQQEGIEISHVADLPGQTGLGSSSAFTVGLLNALHAFRHQAASPRRLAEEAIQVERERVGDLGGWQDQVAVAFGGFNRIQFGSDDTVDVRPMTLPPGTLSRLADSLLLVYLGAESSAEAILREQVARTAENTDQLFAMRRMVENAATLLEDGGNLDAFGRLLHESWQAKKSLSAGISNSAIDQAYDAARQAGALGGKLLGAGGRGFLCLYVPPGHREAVRTRLQPLQEVTFRFCSEGSGIIFKSDE